MFGIKCLWEQAHQAGIQCQGSEGDNWPLFKMNHSRTHAGPLWVAVLEAGRRLKRRICADLAFFVSYWSKSIQEGSFFPSLEFWIVSLGCTGAAWETRSHTLLCGCSFKSASGMRSQSFWVVIGRPLEGSPVQRASKCPWLLTAVRQSKRTGHWKTDVSKRI